MRPIAGRRVVPLQAVADPRGSSSITASLDIVVTAEANNVSQPVFARYLNTSESTVEKWETGAKKPSGLALKLLSLVQRHGLRHIA